MVGANMRHFAPKNKADLLEAQAAKAAQSDGARQANAKRYAKRPLSDTQSQSQSQSQSETQSETIIRDKAVSTEVRTACEVPDEEELLRRTRDLVGEKDMEGKQYFYWRTLILFHDFGFRPFRILGFGPPTACLRMAVEDSARFSGRSSAFYIYIYAARAPYAMISFTTRP